MAEAGRFGHREACSGIRRPMEAVARWLDTWFWGPRGIGIGLWHGDLQVQLDDVVLSTLWVIAEVKSCSRLERPWLALAYLLSCSSDSKSVRLSNSSFSMKPP